MRKQIIAGNWKMNTSLNEGIDLAKAIVEASSDLECQLIIAPPFTHLGSIGNTLKDSNVNLAAQNCSEHESGAYTGEVAASMLKDLECSYVVIGHSERRQYHFEDEDMLAEKTKHVLAQGMKVIFCCGELLEDRRDDQHFDVVRDQLIDSLSALTSEQFGQLVIAYEPVWAIGTGETATPEQAQEMHAFIRSWISDKYDEELAQQTSIIYGGSVKPNNSTELFAKEDIDGGLIGGASLKAADFIAIAKAIKAEHVE